MGITQIIDPFYKPLDESTFRKQPHDGQIVWVPVAFRHDVPQIMDVERNTPTDHFASKFSVRGMTAKDFTKKQKLPIKLLNLGETEELIVTRYKLRPAIVLLTASTVYADLSATLKGIGKGHLEHEVVGIVPLYSAGKEDHDTGFPPVMIARIKALMYPQFFYCPNKSGVLRNPSIARLDRLFFVRPIAPALQPTAFALSEDAVAVLSGLLAEFLNLGMPADEAGEFEAIRNLALETLPPEAKNYRP